MTDIKQAGGGAMAHFPINNKVSRFEARPSDPVQLAGGSEKAAQFCPPGFRIWFEFSPIVAVGWWKVITLTTLTIS